MTTLPSSQRDSAITAADLAAGRLRLGEGFVLGHRVCWLQSNPVEKGRTTLMTRDGDLTPGWDLRTPIHEYGGTPVALNDSLICFFDRGTQRVWVDQGQGPRPITPSGPWVFGGLTILGDEVIAVREDLSPTLDEPTDTIVALDLNSDNLDGGRLIASGADFYFSPAVSPGGWIAWMEYDHPSMPWGSTRIMALDPERRLHTIADSLDVSSIHPQWEEDGSLIYLSDESGYWNFHRWNGTTTRLHDHPYDFCEPPWVLSQPPYALLSEDGVTRIGCVWWQEGMAHLGTLDPDGTLTTLGVYASASAGPSANGKSVVSLGTVTESISLQTLDWMSGDLELLVQESNYVIEQVSIPERITWVSSDSSEISGWYYPPLAPAGPPPVLLTVHSGPTSYSPCVFSLVKQFFAIRGIAVLDVNYSGSSTMGRAFRERLNGEWGILDVHDCVEGAQRLVDLGLADGDRIAIMGGSAGGFTTLAALTTSDVFSAGILMYGISDLEALAHKPHKFEAHYNDALIAPYPKDRHVHIERSPINHVDRLTCPLLILQGEVDQVVPLSQATMMYEAVRAKGLDAELVIYKEEGHGFRQATTIEDAYTRILAFLERTWAYTPTEGQR